MNRYLLKLFVLGRTARSRRAIANVEQLCREVLPEQHELIIVDVLEQPDVAEEDKILATPTLLKVSPSPEKRIIGDFSEGDLLALALDLQV